MKLKIFLILILFSCSTFADWYEYPKAIIGNVPPLSNKSPYAKMTNLENGLWTYSNYFIPGVNLDIKFGVQTNINSSYLLELIKPFNLTIPFGYNNNTYYLTNKDDFGNPINIVKVKEGTLTNKFVELEFNFEGDPDPPANINAIIDSQKVIINWSKSVELDVIGYNIYISNKFLPSFVKLNTSLIKSNSFEITSLSNGITNYIYVTSVDAYTNMPNNESPPSSIIQVVPGKPITALIYCKMNKDFIPGGLYIAGEPSPLNWNGSKMEFLYNNIWFYKLKTTEFTTLKYKYKYTDKTNIWERDFNTQSKNREVTLIDYDNDGIVTINNIWNMEKYTNKKPSPPTNIIAIPGNSNVLLIWSKNKELDVLKYKIFRSNFNTNFHLIAETENTNYRDLNLLNNTNYYYKLKSVDNSGYESDFSSIIIVTPSTNPKPIKPKGLIAIAGNSNVILKWNPNPEPDIKNYLLYRSTNYYSNYSIIASTNSTIYTDKNLINNITYYYKLRVVDTISQTNDGFSEIVSATPSTNPAPSQPKNLKLLLAGDKFLIINWSPNPETDIAYYKIYYGTNSFSISNISSTTTATLTSLSNGKKYQIALKAVDNANNHSQLSETIYAYPLFTISDLKAYPNGNQTGSVILNFTSPKISKELGSAVRYIVKYSTNKINNLIDFQNANYFGEFPANYSETPETIIVNNLGTGCPGFYFAVASLYNDELAVGLSKSVYSVSAESISSSKGKTIYKINEKTKIIIPPNTLPNDATAIVIKNNSDLLKENNPNLEKISNAFKLAKSYPYINLPSENIFYEIYALNSASQKIPIDKLNNYIQIFIPFPDSDHNEIFDSTSININNLKLFRLNENNNEWAFIQKSTVNKIDNLCYGYIDKFGIYTILAIIPAETLERAVVYPNPAISPSDNNPIIFKNLTPGSKIKIFNLAGELVKDALIADNNGICTWNALNDSNNKVSSGLYIYYIEDNKGNTKKGKFAIVR
jgi:fibronectin type 3 domain-containing protein